MVKKNNLINNKSDTFMVIDYLEGVIGDEMILNSYIRDVEIVSRTGTTVTFQVNSKAGIDAIEENYKHAFSAALESVFGINYEPVFIRGGERILYEKKESKTSKNIAKRFVFDNFVVSSFNSEAARAASSISKTPGKYSPLYISSGSGLGKTHLLHAIGNEVDSKGLSAFYLEPNEFTKKITTKSKLGGDSITNYLNSLKEYDILLFDDIQNLSNREVTLRALLDLINYFLENEKQIVIASDKVAQELSGFESRFITRFVSGLSVKIEKPSEKDIKKILVRKLDDSGLDSSSWESGALRFMARNNTSSIRSLEGAVKRVLFYTEDDEGVEYTLTVISEIFQSLSLDASELTSDRILSTVSDYYKVSKKDIIGKSRKKEIVSARHVGIYLTRQILGLSYSEIGKIFGSRDHSTIMSACKSIDKSKNMDQATKMALRALENKIKTVG
ncbi:MAG: chromosomal replication initiator protein DnaA [Mycoplasmataceae bacterium]|nr:chromosomal replication initiator protein DnaA [Mycoplasmataceae bacterium]